MEILNDVVFNNSVQNKVTHFADNFDTAQLDLNWNFRRYPIEDVYKINKEENRLNLFCHPNQIKERGRAALLGFKQTESDFEYLTQMYFQPKSSDSEAGISLFQKDDNYINFTIIKKGDKHQLQVYAIKNGEILELIKDELRQYRGNIKFKVIADKDVYKLYYSLKGMDFRLFTSLEGSYLKSNGYTGAHLGLYATGNGKNNQDFASFDYVNYLIKKK